MMGSTIVARRFSLIHITSRAGSIRPTVLSLSNQFGQYFLTDMCSSQTYIAGLMVTKKLFRVLKSRKFDGYYQRTLAYL